MATGGQPKYKKPTHFLCVRLSDPRMWRCVEDMQAAIFDIDDRYDNWFTSLSFLHVTLWPLGLDTPDQVTRARRTLRDAKDELSKLVKDGAGVRINLLGVGHFYRRVMYVRVQQEPNFMRFADRLKALFTEAGVEIRQSKGRTDLKPHVTVMKAPGRGMPGSESDLTVDPSMLRMFAHTKFPHHDVDAVHLCEMDGEAVDDFYATPETISLV